MQISGGFAAALAGLIVVQDTDGRLLHYPLLGIVVTATIVITILLMYFINKMVYGNKKEGDNIPPEPVLAELPVTKH
jgi:hypothetical protein